MTLTTHCADCHCPLVTRLPANTTEADAQNVAQRLRCVRCVMMAFAQTIAQNANESAARGSVEAAPRRQNQYSKLTVKCR